MLLHYINKITQSGLEWATLVCGVGWVSAVSVRGQGSIPAGSPAHQTSFSDGYTQKDLSFKFSEQHPITYIDGAMQSINFVVNDVRTESCDSKTSTGTYQPLPAK